MERLNPFRETKFLGTHGDREILIFPVQLTTSRIGNRGTGRLNPSRETKFSGTHGNREILIFPVLLSTSRIGDLTRLIHTLLYVIHTYIHTPLGRRVVRR